MDDRQLSVLLLDLESDRVERKESMADKKKLRQAICAFANDLPGHGLPGILFVGARDDGSCAGLTISDQLLQDLASMRDDGNILPLPSLTVQKRTIRGCELAVVLVEPALAPPVRFHGRVWVRVGPRRAIATPDDERRLAERRRSSDLPFELRPLPTASLEDLDLDLFERTYLRAAVASDVLEANRRSTLDQLKSLRFADRNGLPTVLGLLVVGRDGRSWIPGAYVQFLRVAGKELAAPIGHEEEISGPLPQLLGQLDRVLSAHIQVAVEIPASQTDVRRPDYPLAALQQLARNAVLHRSYEGTNAPIRIYWFQDRVEIHSPGGPYGQVTVENFGQPGMTDYRNRHLAEAMKALGYVQRFGVGLPIARQELQRNGNPELELEAQPTHVLARVRRAR